jgi:Mrp family chromosome partitioning ATPase
MLGSGVSAGLMDLLEGVVDLRSVLVCSAAEGLWMIPSGESVATERSHLGGEAMAALLTRLHGMFELVVIDAPPVGEEPSVAALAAAAGATIVAVRARRTEEEELSSALEILGASGANVMGLVLTYAPE